MSPDLPYLTLVPTLPRAVMCETTLLPYHQFRGFPSGFTFRGFPFHIYLGFTFRTSLGLLFVGFHFKLGLLFAGLLFGFHFGFPSGLLFVGLLFGFRLGLLFGFHFGFRFNDRSPLYQYQFQTKLELGRLGSPNGFDVRQLRTIIPM